MVVGSVTDVCGTKSNHTTNPKRQTPPGIRGGLPSDKLSKPAGAELLTMRSVKSGVDHGGKISKIPSDAEGGERVYRKPRTYILSALEKQKRNRFLDRELFEQNPQAYRGGYVRMLSAQAATLQWRTATAGRASELQEASPRIHAAQGGIARQEIKCRRQQ